MAFFNSKLRYALCAAIDLAQQPLSTACQSREIASRQDIPGPYLDQILAALKSAGLVRSIRGAGGGYCLARAADHITAAEVVKAVMRGDRLVAGRGEDERVAVGSKGAGWVVQEFESQLETLMVKTLEQTTLAELAQKKNKLDDSLSMMMGI